MFAQPGRLPTSRITTREAANKQNHDHGAYVPTTRIATRGLPGWLVGWLASGITYDQGTCHALGWLSGWLGGWLAGWLRRLEAPHKQIYMRPGRAPHKVFFGTREEAAVDCMVGRLCVCMYVCRVPDRNPLQTQGLPTSRIMDVCTTLEAPRKQNYDQGGSPQAELRPGKLPTSRITTGNLPTSKITTRELAGWLAGWLAALQPGNLFLHLAGWLAGRLAGWLPG